MTLTWVCCAMGVLLLPAVGAGARETLTIAPGGDPIFHDKIPELFLKAHPEVDLKVVGNNPDALAVQYATGTGPDVIQVAPEYYDTFRRKGFLLALDDMIDAVGLGRDQFAYDISPWAYNGRLYGVPIWAGMGPAMAYNPNLFSNAGVPPMNDQWTWSDLNAAALKLTRPGPDGNVQQWAISGNGGLVSDDVWLTFVWQNGGELYNPDETASLLDSPQAIGAFSELRHLQLESRVVSPTSQDLFAKDQAAMAFTYASISSRMTQWKGVSWETAPIPYQTKKVIGGQQTLSWAIGANTKNPKLALEYVAFMLTDPDALAYYSQQSTPSTKVGLDVWRKLTPPDIQEKFDSAWFTRLFCCSHPRPRDSRWPAVQKVLHPEIVALLAGKQSPDETGRRATQAVNGALRDVAGQQA